MEALTTPRDRALRRKASMFNERSSWVEQWREISEFQQPRLGRFFISDTNKGRKRFNSIIDSTALIASRTLAAGMMSGMTSPARPWFKSTFGDRDLMERPDVKTWLYIVDDIMRSVFNKSNTYRSLHMLYEELGLFGTGASIVLDDFDNVIHHYPLTVGEFALGCDFKGRPDSLAREFQMNVGQLVNQFGLKNVSTTVKNAWDRHSVDDLIPVLHLIQPNEKNDPSSKDARAMKFSSQYLELGAKDDTFLSESGFKTFPVLAPRWSVTGNDIYGMGPGMEALGDVKQLQHQQMRKGQAIDYQVNPPLQVPTQYKDAARNRLPGGVMFVDAQGPGGGVRTAYEVQLNLQHLLLDIQDVRDRIKTAYYADLFLMLANDTRSGITATEVAERHEEKLLMLGPVLERLQNELLQPLIELTFSRCATAGIFPPAPKVLQGRELNVEFVSTLAQAQRVVSAQGTDRLLGSIASMAQMNPDVRDKIKWDQVVDDYADMYGVNPEIIVPDAVAAAQRLQRAKALQAAQQAASAPQMAQAAQTAGDTNVQGLKDVMNAFTGYSTPSTTAAA